MQHKYRCVAGRLIFLIGSKGLPTGHVGNGKQHQHGASNGYGHGRDKVLAQVPRLPHVLAAGAQKGLLPTIEAREPV